MSPHVDIELQNLKTMNSKFSVIVILVVSIVSCAQKYKNPKLTEKETNTDILRNRISQLNIENPKSDLLKNVKKGDNRFMGINGYSCFAPGVEQKEQSMVIQNGIRCLEVTSDAIESIEHGKLINVVSKYAKEYNQLLIKEKLDEEY